jgi:peptide/nickel transport system substrate-binding protein
MRLYRAAARTTDPQEQNALLQEIIAINAEQRWKVGTVGRLPAPIIVHRQMRNVPEVALYNWTAKSPGNTAVECYAIVADEDHAIGAPHAED